jgi:hypothetical protein
MAYGDVIPPDARVDRDEFPECDFPVYCPDCSYLLHGLPEDRCPECGFEYDRGRLLVRQYVIEGGKRSARRTASYAKWTLISGLLLASILPVLCGIWVVFLDPANMSIMARDYFNFAGHIAMYLMFLSPVLFFVSCGFYIRLSFVLQGKSRAVFEGIDRAAPTYQAAQKNKWVFWVFCVVAMLGVVAWMARSNDGWYRYYRQSPARVILTVTLAFGVATILYLGKYLYERRGRSADDDTPSVEQ